MEFPIGKKLFHLVVNPGTWRCPTVDLELVQTTINVNGTRDSVRKFQPGKRNHLFRFSTFSWNFPVGRTDETCSIYRRTGDSGNFEQMESALRIQSSAVRQSGNFRQMVNDTYRSYGPKIPNQNFRNFFINGKQRWFRFSWRNLSVAESPYFVFSCDRVHK